MKLPWFAAALLLLGSSLQARPDTKSSEAGTKKSSKKGESTQKTATPEAKAKKAADEDESPNQFFGIPIKENRVVFIVDFSGSMDQGDRIKKLKKDLDQTLAKLGTLNVYNVIYYSHRPWLGGENVGNAPFRDPENAADRIPWRAARAENLKETRKQLANMTIGGATSWVPPLRLALAMKPRPEAIYLLTDGEANDREELVENMTKINPHKVPIHTCAMELGGPTFKSLIDIAEKTGGKFSIIREGKVIVGEKARKLK